MFKYFVSYSYMRNDGTSGFGNCQIMTEAKITGFERIEEISTAIKNNNKFDNIIIINWRLFEEE